MTQVAATMPSQPAYASIFVNEAQGRQLATRDNERLHVLFPDQSALTLGPDTALVIEEYRFDPQTRTGKIALRLDRGVVRVVGGFISKTTDVVVTTSDATFALRGGIGIFQSGIPVPSASTGTLLFGQKMTATSNASTQTVTVTRPGSSVNMSTGSPVVSSTTALQVAAMNALVSSAATSAPAPAAGPAAGSAGSAPAARNSGWLAAGAIGLVTVVGIAAVSVNGDNGDSGDSGDSDSDTEGLAPDRLAGAADGPSAGGAPTLGKLLGSPGPGNQS